jgi:hypothetical protein
VLVDAVGFGSLAIPAKFVDMYDASVLKVLAACYTWRP